MIDLLKILPVFLFLLSCSNSVKDSKEELAVSVIPQDKTAYLNGKIHGTTLQEEVKEQLENWEKGIKAHLGIGRDSAVAIIYEHTGFLGAIKKYTPGLMDEINGIADGAGVDEKILLCYNLGEEIYNYCKADFEVCSNMAYVGEKQKVLAYNQDLPQFLRGRERPVVLEHQSYFVFSMPGSVALSAVSSDIAISCNSLPMLRMNKMGLPLPFFIRQLITYPSLKEAKLFIENTPLAVPQNILLMSKDGMMNAEISRDTISWTKSIQESSFYHTNFPLNNRDYKFEDYEDLKCDRFHYLDSMSDKIKANPEESIRDIMEYTFGSKSINNEETYLRYIVTFVDEQHPKLALINPRRGEKMVLKF